MWFVVIGVLLIGMNMAGVWFPGEWTWGDDWWKMLWPFGAAAVWWIGSDSMGLTKKREMDKMEAKKAERRRKNLENLGLHDPRSKVKKTVSARERAAEKIEAKRSRIREVNKEVVRHSRLDSEQSSGYAESQPPARS